MTKLCPRGKAAAKRKFKVYPSAYANAYASKICAGKIKDPSGVKRKDFRGPKPAAKGAMMTAGSQSAMGRIQKARMMNKGGGADLKKDPTKPVNPFLKRRMKLAGAEALKAAKATRIGKIAAGVAGAALIGKAALEKMYEKRTGKKPFTKREKKRTLVDKKMGGGMMNMPGYKKGKSVMAKGCKLGRKKPTKMYT